LGFFFKEKQLNVSVFSHQGKYSILFYFLALQNIFIDQPQILS
jgi:hypothetical protein